jgi:hypothetical protein
MSQDSAKFIILIGVGVVALGMILYFFHDRLHWIGRLPGDIRIEKENFRFYFPIMTMILFSLILSVIIRIFRKF